VSLLLPARPAPPPEAWQPRPYPQLLRGPRHRWWRPLVSASVVLGGVLLLFLVLTVLAVVASQVSAADPAALQQDLLTTWWGFLANNLFLAALVPLSVLAVFAGHRWRPRWVSSVEGGLRWRWLLLSAVVPAAGLALDYGGTWLYARSTGQAVFGSGDPGGTGSVVALLAVVVLTTPLQAAGEEYFFRGWLSQAVGSWFARARVGAVVAGAVSALLFGLAHGSQSPWLFVDRAGFGVLASYLAWRTGGLEAGIAFHSLNNIVIFVPTILAGGLGEALSNTSAPAGPVLVDLAMFALVAVGVTWLARSRGVQRLFVPPRAAIGPEQPPPAYGPPVGLG
jgi:uncharacterized protein